MAKRDCKNCAHCVWKKMAYTKGYTNTCEMDKKIRELSLEELEELAKKNECPWFEQGTPKMSNDVCFDD